MQNAKKKLPFLTRGGALLSDHDIKLALDTGYLKIETRFPLNIQPSSVDVHLAKTIITFARRRMREAAIDLKKPLDHVVEYEVMDEVKGAVIHPGEFILGVTEEWLKMPSQLAMNVDGKSSLGRVGLVIHATAGFVDPGFHGHVTLEIANLTEQPLIIYPYMPIGQFRFTVLTSPADVLYGAAGLGSKYFNDYSQDAKPMASQYYKNFMK